MFQFKSLEHFSKHIELNPFKFIWNPDFYHNKSAGGGPWPPTWVTSQNHGAKTIFLLVHLPF